MNEVDDHNALTFAIPIVVKKLVNTIFSFVLYFDFTTPIDTAGIMSAFNVTNTVATDHIMLFTSVTFTEIEYKFELPRIDTDDNEMVAFDATTDDNSEKPQSPP